jgi:2-polyprenyl-3-methyl-5-hydroxy-6-metoxy-1,4-benzoquinol methylase
MSSDFRQQKQYSRHFSDPKTKRQKRNEALQILSKVGKYTKGAQSVLDIGCGIGMLAVEIGKQSGAAIHGIDLNDAAVRLAKLNGVAAKKADLEEKWPFEKNTFDIVIGAQIIEHVIGTDHFIQESFRLLKPNGYLIITTPNLSAWFNRILLLFGYQPFFLEASTKDKTVGLRFTQSLTKEHEPAGHIRVMTHRALGDLLEMYGFEIVESKGSAVHYLPSYMKVFDRIFSLIPSLASDMIYIATKKK